MDRSKNGDSLGAGEQARGPGHRLEGRSLEIRGAAITLPAANRENEIKARLIRKPSHGLAALPIGEPTLGERVDRAARRAIGAKQPQLESVVVVHLIAIGRHDLCFSS